MHKALDTQHIEAKNKKTTEPKRIKFHVYIDFSLCYTLNTKTIPNYIYVNNISKPERPTPQLQTILNFFNTFA